jgi:hypothetical protein
MDLNVLTFIILHVASPVIIIMSLHAAQGLKKATVRTGTLSCDHIFIQDLQDICKMKDQKIDFSLQGTQGHVHSLIGKTCQQSDPEHMFESTAAPLMGCSSKPCGTFGSVLPGYPA